MTDRPLPVSVIIPAYNAAKMLGETLTSLLTQTHTDWEAIVVDDGSKDDTVRIAEEIAVLDARIRVIRQANAGVSTARNHGIALARHDWLLFLDSDDWIVCDHLEKMTGALVANPTLDCIYCGWTYVSPTGEHFQTVQRREREEMFKLLTKECPFTIHGCLNRKSIVQTVGGFDPTMSACEDWDLWLRIARTGATFDYIDEPLALYRMRPGSLSTNAERMLYDGIRLYTVAHDVDPRVPNPHPKYAQGYNKSMFADKPVPLMAWIAGRLIGEGKEAIPLMDAVSQWIDLSCNPSGIAYSIHDSLPLSQCCTATGLIALREEVAEPLQNFLQELERRSGVRYLKDMTLAILDRLIIEGADFKTPVTVGNFYGLGIDLEQPIPSVAVPPTAEQLFVAGMLDGVKLGTIELPVIDGQISMLVLQDALAVRFGWPILANFFQQTLFAGDPNYDHESQGWEIFLQQFWGCPGVSSGDFYDEHCSSQNLPPASKQQVTDRCEVEISHDLPDLKVSGSELQIIATVAGQVLCTVTLPVVNGQVSAQQLRVAISLASGVEACNLAVREALLGQSLSEKVSLRERLQRALSARSESRLFNEAETSAVIARRPGAIESSVMRRYALPSETIAEVTQMVEACGEQLAFQKGENSRSQPILYLPEVLARPTGSTASENVLNRTKVCGNDPSARPSTPATGREQFEMLFAEAKDPWKYTSAYEQLKYDQTLSLIQTDSTTEALELACAEGHFTRQLAPRVARLTSVDISKLALGRASERCRDMRHVAFRQGNFFSEPIEGFYDLIVCSEVLYFVENQVELHKVAQKIAGALKPNGQLVMAHAFQTVDAPGEPGFDWGHAFGAKTIRETFQSLDNLELESEIRTPLYSVQAFRRPKTGWRKVFRPKRQAKVEIIAEQPTSLPDLVAQCVRWKGETVSPAIEPPVETHALPILMYHRVSPTGCDALRAHRVTPEQFEEQLDYLRDAGYYTIDWNTWSEVRLKRKPLPGRAIAFTFDDGYQDFYDFAWPLLKKYGFTATVFLVADRVGDTNDWDRGYGETIPLMGWPAIKELHAAGIQFGSHTTTHKPLTSLSSADVVRQLARSRSILQYELGVPITTIAYPYGDCNNTTFHLAGACGYQVGVTCENWHAEMEQPLLALPRIDVAGNDTLATFIKKLIWI